MVYLLYATGLRVSELVGLTTHEIDLKMSYLRVKGKGGRDRLAFVVDDQTVRIQKEHITARVVLASESQALFLNASGERLSTQGIANIIAQFRKEGNSSSYPAFRRRLYLSSPRAVSSLFPGRSYRL